ncbi:hypothetical protein GSI_05721 [Ganoderma sinense ZZ0214-1]|uniref:Uncharacterized protein n=1 Tax=Ganoderma sinense ZZ0214-1 TaxID=1077348 RepID=A0A2G8SB85_9APHY|nr:hypothetical protein GSI_05721 [Ganoderma sinense ZZ0214-1]
MSQPPLSVTNPGDAGSAPSNLLTGAELTRYLNQPSEPILGKKRALSGRLAHLFDNGKSLRKGRSHSNAPALELNEMYDKLIRTRRRRVLQGMEQAPVVPRSTSVPLSTHVGPEIRSSTAALHEFSFVATKKPVLPSPQPEENSAPGPSNVVVDEETIHAVKVVYAHFHGLSTFMSDGDARALWNNMNDEERTQLFQYYRDVCAKAGPAAGPQDGESPHVQPLNHSSQPQPSSSEVIQHPSQVNHAGSVPSSALIAGQHNEPSQEEILTAVKVVHARHYSLHTSMSDEGAWALWCKWNIQEQQELLVRYRAICAGIELNAPSGDEQEPRPEFEPGEGQRQPPPPTTLHAHSGPPLYPPPEYHPPPQNYFPGTGYQAGPPPPQQVVDTGRPFQPPTGAPILPPAGGHAPYPNGALKARDLSTGSRIRWDIHRNLRYASRSTHRNHFMPKPGHIQRKAADRSGLSLVGASIPAHVMHYPTPSRPGPSLAYLGERTTSSQTTRTDDIDRMTEETITQGTAALNDMEGFQVGSKLDKGKRRATSTGGSFLREGAGDFHMFEWDAHRTPTPTATPVEGANFRLNQRPERMDVPQFVNSDGTILVINKLEGLTDAVRESIRAQNEFSKEFKLFRELRHNSPASLGENRRLVQPQTAQQRRLADTSLRALKREKRVNDKVQRLCGKSARGADEADDEGGNEADDESDGVAQLRDVLEEEGHFRRLKARVRHSVTSFLGVYDWSMVAHQYPTLTAQQLQDYKLRKDYIVPTVSNNFRPDFHLPWKRHPFNKENREVFIDKFLARIEGGAYFKNPTPEEMLTRECIGFVLDNHMRYCRDRWRRSLHPLSPERAAEVAKEGAQRSRRRTLHQSREVLIVRRGYTKHRNLIRLLDPCNMSGDETDGEKTTDSDYRIITSRWQSQELRNFLWTIDAHYRQDWANPTHRRAMGGNRPRTRVLRQDGRSEGGIAPIGLWRNCYDQEWLDDQPAYIIRELEVVDEDYDFSIVTPAPTATGSASATAAS